MIYSISTFNPCCIEPVTVSIGIYVLTKSKKIINTRTLTRTKYINTQIIKFIDYNKELLIDAGKEELVEFISDTKILNYIKLNPTIAVTLYFIILLAYIIF
jgi:hypothetical protein